MATDGHPHCRHRFAASNFEPRLPVYAQISRKAAGYSGSVREVLRASDPEASRTSERFGEETETSGSGLVLSCLVLSVSECPAAVPVPVRGLSSGHSVDTSFSSQNWHSPPH